MLFRQVSAGRKHVDDLDKQDFIIQNVNGNIMMYKWRDMRSPREYKRYINAISKHKASLIEQLLRWQLLLRLKTVNLE